ncbi:MAG: hypothetical protein IJS09_08355 [Treponema sp.]|nr:hypothetical protein [Treponema sp.]
MKKFCLISAILLAVTLSAFSEVEQTYKYEFQESKLSYHNVTVYKVLDHKDAYIVMYAKGHRDVGSVTIPKKWYSTKPSKLSFRSLPKGMAPYMTVIKKEGNFDRVILTMPVDHGISTVWGVADPGTVVNDADKDSLEIVY